MRHARQVMGTAFAVEVDADHATVESVFDWWREVEARFSTFRPDSEISRIARGELALDDAHADVRHVLATCDELERATGGRFVIRPDAARVDPAGFVKGWSVDEAALLLRAVGHEDFMLYAGGDVLCSGSPPDAEQWSVGVRDPRDPDRVVAALPMGRGAVATSGAYERGAHVWGSAPGVGLASVTVVGPSLGVADALATALYAAGADDDTGWLHGFEGYGALLVLEDGSVRAIGSPRIAG